MKLGRGLKLARLTSVATSIPLGVRNEFAEKVRSVLAAVDPELAPETSRIVEDEEIEPSLALLTSLVGDFGGGPRPIAYPKPVLDSGIGRDGFDGAEGTGAGAFNLPVAEEI